jgi:AraC-like DNA-binding protein
MGSRRRVDNANRLTSLVEPAPPVVPVAPSRGTKAIDRRRNAPVEGRVGGLKEHSIVARPSSHSDGCVKVGKRTIADPLASSALGIVSRGRDNQRRSSGAKDLADVFLSDDHLQLWADELANGRRPEVLDRLGLRDPKLLTIMRLLNDEGVPNEPVSRLFVEQLVDLLRLHLVQSHSLVVSAHPQWLRGLAPWQIKHVTAYMRENLAENIGLRQLADIVNLSRSHFCAAFRMATGYTPHEWRTKVRVQEAQRLLRNSVTPITEIALAVGYQTPSAFTAAFRRLVGVTPREFRRRT